MNSFNYEVAYGLLKKDFKCIKMLNSMILKTDREDVMQETALSLFRAYQRYNKSNHVIEENQVKFFVRKILHDVIVNHIKKQTRKINASTFPMDFNMIEADEKDRTGEEVYTNVYTESFSHKDFNYDVIELKIDFERIQNRLSDQHKEIAHFIFKVPFGYDYKHLEIARFLNCDNSAITYCKKRIKSLLS